MVCQRGCLMIAQVIMLIVGLIILYFGAEWLVGGASKLAFALGITPLIIGLTVVAYGTSAPELLVTSAASWRGASDVSLGNIIGSNICNIALILGVAAIIRPIHVDPGTLRRDYPLMLASAVALYLMAWIGRDISRLDGGILFAGMIVYTAFTVRNARRSMRAKKQEQAEAGEQHHVAPQWRNIGLIIGGVLALALGAELMVRGAIAIALDLGIDEFVIAVSVVAFGTSVPELATSAVAALKDQSDISVGNVIGSNLCNVLWVIGLVSLFFGLPVDERSLSFDFPIMIGFTLLLYPLARTGFYIGRGKGVMLLVGYVGYVAALFLLR